jgi:HAD superfamily hydrolase (TIGR01509 family)
MIEIGDAKGLIFDCDGTLVDSMPLHMEAWKHAFQIMKEDYNYAYLDSKKGMKESEIIELYNKEFNKRLNPEAIIKIKHEYFNNQLKFLKPIAPVVDLVFQYHRKLPMGVVSGSLRKTVHAELEIIGIIEKFDYILTANDNFKPKPAPDKFLEAARLMKLNPEDCLVFEDGDLGIKAAQLAGMKTMDVRNVINASLFY